MKAKTENITLTPGSGLHADLSGMIEQQHQDLLRSTNAGLIVLFWNLGKLLNQYLDVNKRSRQNRSVFSAISGQLVTNYGPYFMEKNLKKMAIFASHFPDYLSIIRVAAYISWEHFVVLLKIKETEARVFYIRLTVEKNLTVSGLGKQIADNLFERQPVLKVKKSRSISRSESGLIFPPLPAQGNRMNPLINNFFKEPLASPFRPLMELSSEVETTLPEDNGTTEIGVELFGVLSLHIEKYRSSQNMRLNTDLNALFRKIGERIYRAILENTNENITRKSIISDASIYLGKKFGKNFSEEQLRHMVMFAEQFSDAHISWRVASLVRWEHIVVLLSLSEMEAKLFYARLAASKGLSVAALQQAMADNVYEQTSGAKEQEQLTMTTIQNPTIEKIEETKGNSTVSITNVLIDLGSDLDSSLVVKNIFKNTCFLDFVSAM